MDEHFSTEEMERLLALELRPELGDRLFHLVLCFDCQDRLRSLHPERGSEVLLRLFGRERPLPPAARDPRLLPWLERTLEPWRPKVRKALEEIDQAGALIDDLLAQPPERRRLLAGNHRRYHTLGFASVLLEEIPDLWHEDPPGARELAELALTVLHALCRATYRPDVVHDFTARAWAYLGNSHRILSDLPEADRCFRQAERHLDLGSGDPLDAARVFDLESSLRRDQRRFAEAKALLDVALAIYRSLNDPRQEARVSINKAYLLDTTGESREAMETLDQLCRRFGPEEIGERNYLCAQHNLAMALLGQGFPRRVRDLLPDLRRLADELGPRQERVRVDWLEALVAHKLGDHEPAERLYRQVGAFFAEHGLPYDAALVSLDLTALYLEQGRTAEVRELAAEMMPLFLAQDVHREAVAALVAFHQAVEAEAASVAMVRELSRYLQQVRRLPLPPAAVQ